MSQHRGGFRLRLVALTRKEVRQLLRDKSNLAIGIVLPIVLILLFGYGLSMDVKNAPVAVVMDDNSPAAIEVASGMDLSPYLSPTRVTSMHQAEQLMRDREVDAIVRFPSDFAAGLAAGDARVQVLVHGADAARATIIQSYLAGALSQWSLRQQDRAGPSDAASGRVEVQERLWFNAANTSTWYLVPGLIVLIMTLVGAFLTALVMARERERGTLEALFVTPVRPVEILIAKTIPYFCIGMIGLGMCLLAARFLFDVPMYGSLLAMIVTSMLYLFVAVGLGLLISSITRNQFLASQFALLVSFLPSVMLSGFLFDLRNVPMVIRTVGQVLPATYYMESIRTLFLAGNTWPMLLKNWFVLAAYAVFFIGLARWVTRKRLD